MQEGNERVGRDYWPADETGGTEERGWTEGLRRVWELWDKNRTDQPRA